MICKLQIFAGNQGGSKVGGDVICNMQIKETGLP